jgi:hypothetical protein
LVYFSLFPLKITFWFYYFLEKLENEDKLLEDSRKKSVFLSREKPSFNFGMFLPFCLPV